MQSEIDTMMPKAVATALGVNFHLNSNQQEALRALLGGYAVEKSLYDAQRITSGITELLQFIHDHAGNAFNAREDRIAKLNRFETMFAQIFGNPTELAPLLIDSSDVMVAKSQFFATMTQTIAMEIEKNSGLLSHVIADIKTLSHTHQAIVSEIDPELAQALSSSINNSLDTLVTTAIADISSFQKKAALRKVDAQAFLAKQNLLINQTLPSEDQSTLQKNISQIKQNVETGFQTRDKAIEFILSQLQELKSELEESYPQPEQTEYGKNIAVEAPTQGQAPQYIAGSIAQPQ